MRYVTKQVNGGFQLSSANANPPTTSSQATSRWRRFAYKNQVQSSLLGEQYQLCCYSELRADEECLGYHIEHVENKNQNPQRTFDYTNLAASALGSANGLRTLSANGGVVFGGHATGKQAGVDLSRFVSCHDPNCRRYFAFLSDGRITSAVGLSLQDKDRADYTISLLNLNSPYLITRRRQWWDELDAIYREHNAKSWSLDHLAAVDLLPTNLCLSRFFSLTRQFYGQLAEQILQQHAPGLL